MIEHGFSYSSNFPTLSFSDVRKFRNAGLPMVQNQTDQIYFRESRE